MLKKDLTAEKPLGNDTYCFFPKTVTLELKKNLDSDYIQFVLNDSACVSLPIWFLFSFLLAEQIHCERSNGRKQ